MSGAWWVIRRVTQSVGLKTMSRTHVSRRLRRPVGSQNCLLCLPPLNYSANCQPPITISSSCTPTSPQGTHQPTLELIKDYFTKHVHLNHRNIYLPPFVEIKLHESMRWAPEVMESESSQNQEPSPEIPQAMEMLTFRCGDDGGRLDQAYIVGFIEGVCGYSLVPGCTGDNGRWVFRRHFP